MSRFFVNALAYHARGWSIIPVRGKLAGCRWKQYQTQQPDRDTLKRLFRGGGISGLAVILGDVSGGLVCRDFDVADSYQRWAKDRPELAAVLPTVATSRGQHVYFRNGTRKIIDLGDGELRGGGYCLLPPSRHPSGATYQWAVPLPDGPLPEIADPAESGLAPSGVTERQREQRDRGYRGDEERGCGGLRTVDDAISATLPKQPGQRDRKVFEFARALKAMPEYADAKPEQLRDAVRRWHKQALPIIKTKDFDLTWFDFLYGWERVKYPLGCEPMAQIFARAVRAELPEAARRYERPEIRLLVSLCRELQRASGERPFFLSCRTAGRLLGVDHVTANRWLFGLAADRVILAVDKGGPGTNRATRYRYVAEG